MNGEEYEANTISNFQRSIQRFLSDNKSQLNILRDKEFEMSRQVLAAKRKRLANKAGKENKQMRLAVSRKNKKRTNCLNADSLVCLDQKSSREPCGGFWHSTLASGRETKAVSCVGAILNSKQILAVAKCLSGYVNEAQKTRNGQGNSHQRSFQPKIYATGQERCPVKYYKTFKSHRPVEMNTADAPFFLAVRHGNRHKDNNI